MQFGAGHDIIKIEIDIPYKKFKVRTSNKKAKFKFNDCHDRSLVESIKTGILFKMLRNQIKNQILKFS